MRKIRHDIVHRSAKMVFPFKFLTIIIFFIEHISSVIMKTEFDFSLLVLVKNKLVDNIDIQIASFLLVTFSVTKMTFVVVNNIQCWDIQSWRHCAKRPEEQFVSGIKHKRLTKYQMQRHL